MSFLGIASLFILRYTNREVILVHHMWCQTRVHLSRFITLGSGRAHDNMCAHGDVIVLDQTVRIELGPFDRSGRVEIKNGLFYIQTRARCSSIGWQRA